VLKNNGIRGVSDCLYIYLKINSLEHENTYIVQSIYFLQCLRYVWPVGMFIYISIYKIPRMPSIYLDQQPTNHWVTKESRNCGLLLYALILAVEAYSLYGAGVLVKVACDSYGDLSS
jgi:hypothetical protein